jgi:acyl-CoA thioester hydrolase
MAYTTTHEVRYGDIDRFGHVNHLRLLEFFESARSPFFRQMAEFEHLPCVLDTAGFVVAHLEAAFHDAVDSGAQVVEVRTSVERVGRSSVTLRYELWHESSLRVTAKAVLVFINEGRKEAMGDERRAFLSQYVTDSAPQGARVQDI